MRLIDADALNDILEQMIKQADIKSREYVMEPVVAHHYEMLKQQIEEILTGISGLPTIESAQPERKKGKWILVKGSNGKDYHKCSECLHTQDITGVKNFCAVCGADVR